jgi:phenol 2-monooxygenase (NADPH)
VSQLPWMMKNGTDSCKDVSLVTGIDEHELVTRFFDGFATGRPRSDQFDLEDIVKKGLKDLNGLMKDSF